MHRIFDTLERRTPRLVAVVVAVTALLVIPFLAMAPEDSASTEPGGLLTALTILMALVATLAVLPAVLVIITTDRQLPAFYESDLDHQYVRKDGRSAKVQ